MTVINLTEDEMYTTTNTTAAATPMEEVEEVGVVPDTTAESLAEVSAETAETA